MQLQIISALQDHAGHPAHTLVGRTLAEVERTLIIDTLRHCASNRTRAASILGISIRTLRNRLREYGRAGIDVTPPGESD